LAVVNVLFVCLGNICRSPSAEAVFRAMVREAGLDGTVAADSAATASWNVGRPPDARARSEARRRGIEMPPRRARRVEVGDFARFDYVLAMDRGNHAELAARCPADASHRLGLFLDFAPDAGRREVPDPYNGGREDFERMFDLIEVGSRGLLDHIRRQGARIPD
jgi:protein-tyrosine phosphatase